MTCSPPDIVGGNTFTLDEDQLRRLNAVLETSSVKPYERDPELKRLLKAYEQDALFIQLITNLDALFTEYALYQQANVDVQTAEAIKDEDLRLVCFERIEPA